MMIKNFDEFVDLWKTGSKDIRIKYPDLLFLVVYPDDLVWDFSVEKQTQTTALMVSGSTTGAGTGHDIQFCYQSQLIDVLKKCHQSHAMIVSVGMVFDMTPSMTSIDEFFHFTKSKLFCKAHIMAKPHEPAYLHHQHIDLNVDMWNNIGSPDIFSKRIWRNYDRADFNFHDDYTPLHLTPAGLPQIDNFSETERSKKAYSYPYQRDYNAVWKDLDNVWKYVDKDDFYFSRFMTRMDSTFYVFNSEPLTSIPDRKYDIFLAPTAGYLTEEFVNKYNFNGEVIFYDYTEKHIHYKRKIIEMNMSLEEMEYFSKISKTPIMVDYGARQQSSIQKEQHEEVVKFQLQMSENCDIDYWVMNLIEPDYNKIYKKVKGKDVFFRASNIFGYHMSHAYYTLDRLCESYSNLMECLSAANFCWFTGTTPFKERMAKVI